MCTASTPVPLDAPFESTHDWIPGPPVPSAHENVVAVKESSDDVRRVIAIRNALGERLAIFTGVDNLALESCLMGADGWADLPAQAAAE